MDSSSQGEGAEEPCRVGGSGWREVMVAPLIVQRRDLSSQYEGDFQDLCE